jgi:hypothetical protein
MEITDAGKKYVESLGFAVRLERVAKEHQANGRSVEFRRQDCLSITAWVLSV